MTEPLIIEIKTLTPLWTGGVDGTCDRLHISGLMGSLRYWYEAIVRGVGGYACDPSNGGGCVYDPKTKEKSICAACYLFGTTGWARLFRLTAVVNGAPGMVKAEEPLHFRTFPRIERGQMGDPNQWWLNRLFEKEHIPVSEEKTIYYPDGSPLVLKFSGKPSTWEYSQSQIKMLIWFLSNFAGLGSRQQYGFGIFQCLTSRQDWIAGMQALLEQKKKCGPEKKPELSAKIHGGAYVHPASLSEFFATKGSVQGEIIKRRVSLPLLSQSFPERSYLASAFDIRYKGDEHVPGFRQVMKRGIDKTSIEALFGSAGKNLSDLERSASRIYVSMPLLEERKTVPRYILRISGFGCRNLNWGTEKLDAKELTWFSYLYLHLLDAKDIQVASVDTLFEWKEVRA
jgi:CRISPR-associated protein Cmr1